MANDRTRGAAEANPPVRRRKTVVLTAKAIQRLGAAAVAEGLDESEIVEMLINAHLSGYVVQVRGARLPRPEDRPSPAVEVNPAAAPAA
jgi:hypothetical protein